MATNNRLDAYIIYNSYSRLISRCRYAEYDILAIVTHVVANIVIEAYSIGLHLGAIPSIYQVDGIRNFQRREVLRIG